MATDTRPAIEYYKSMVVYTDILGFGELIRTETPGQISKILRVFKEQHQARSLFGKSPKRALRVREFVNFSDLCLITNRLDASNESPDISIYFELLSLALGQLALLRAHKVILRGGVTIGLARTSRGLVYGQGIVDAYKLESKDARVPRILVAEEVLTELASCAKGRPGGISFQQGEMLLARDSDGKLFVDYLGVIKQLHPTNIARVLAAHRRFAEQGLRERPAHREKYEWLLAYQQRIEAMPNGFVDKRDWGF